MTSTQPPTQFSGDHKINSKEPTILFPHDFNNIKEAEEKRKAKRLEEEEKERKRVEAAKEHAKLMETEQGRAQVLKNAQDQVATLTIENKALQERLATTSAAETESNRLRQAALLDRDNYQKELSALKLTLPREGYNDLPRQWEGAKVYIINNATGLALDCFYDKYKVPVGNAFTTFAFNYNNMNQVFTLRPGPQMITGDLWTRWYIQAEGSLKPSYLGVDGNSDVAHGLNFITTAAITNIWNNDYKFLWEIGSAGTGLWYILPSYQRRYLKLADETPFKENSQCDFATDFKKGPSTKWILVPYNEDNSSYGPGTYQAVVKKK